jgi:hypothetical protein
MSRKVGDSCTFRQRDAKPNELQAKMDKLRVIRRAMRGNKQP